MPLGENGIDFLHLAAGDAFDSQLFKIAIDLQAQGEKRIRGHETAPPQGIGRLPVQIIKERNSVDGLYLLCGLALLCLIDKIDELVHGEDKGWDITAPDLPGKRLSQEV
jgi:hypothetical protein